MENQTIEGQFNDGFLISTDLDVGKVDKDILLRNEYDDN